MKARKAVNLYFARIQIVKGRFKARIYGIEGAVNLGKPLEPKEVRVTVTPNWLDLHSYSLDLMNEKIAEIRLQRGIVDIRQSEATEIVSATPVQKPRREALKRLAAVLKRELR